MRRKGRATRIVTRIPEPAARELRVLCRALGVRVAAATRAALLRWITEQQRETNQ